METLKSTGKKTLQTKYQAIVFQNQNGSNTQEFHIRHPHPPLLLTVRSILLFSSSYVIPDLWRPPAFPKQLGQISPQVSLLP